MSAPTPAFVAMFDMLGFKRRRFELGTAGLYQLYENGISPGIQHSAALRGKTAVVDGHQMFVPDPGPFSISYRAISDSVIFWTQDDSLVSFMSIIDASHNLMQFGFGPRAPWRGAIGYGDLIVGPEVIIGSAIEDAYSGESAQVWAGAMLTSACRDFVEKHDYVQQRRCALLDGINRAESDHRKVILMQNANVLVEYDVPLQHNPKDARVFYSTIKTFAIDWTIRMFEGAAESALPESTEHHPTCIRNNTIAFEAWARARPDRVC